MRTADITALITGANRGLGSKLVEELLLQGVQKVYATSRDLTGLTDPADSRVTVLELDVTDERSVRQAAAVASDINVLINNAGILHFGTALDGDLEGFQRDMATNYIGMLRVCRSFAPVLAQNSPGMIVNVLTLIALAPVAGMAGYSASKAAAHSMTQALRSELAPRDIRVVGAYPGGIDTDMLAGVEGDKADPAHVARQILNAVAEDREYVFPDDASASAGAVYLADPVALERMLAS